MSRDPDDWTALAGAWRRGGDADAASGGAPASIEGLTRRLRRRDRLARLNFVAEVAACLGAAGVGAWLIARGGPGDPVLGVGAILFSGFALALAAWARAGARRPQTGTPAEALASALAQARSGLRWAWGGLVITGAAAAFVGLVQLVALRLDNAARAAPISTVALVLLAAVGVFHLLRIRRCRRRIRAWRAALDELDAGAAG